MLPSRQNMNLTGLVQRPTCLSLAILLSRGFWHLSPRRPPPTCGQEVCQPSSSSKLLRRFFLMASSGWFSLPPSELYPTCPPHLGSLMFAVSLAARLQKMHVCLPLPQGDALDICSAFNSRTQPFLSVVNQANRRQRNPETPSISSLAMLCLRDI